MEKFKVWNSAMFELVTQGEPMSKYTELKQRIEAINQNTTVKEWDDLLGELYQGVRMVQETPFHLMMCIDTYSGGINITNIRGRNFFHIEYHSQCEKGKAIKKAMLWLLDHSAIKKDEKAEKIAELKKEMEILAGKIKEIEND
ncbi:MAG TPA: hypothetical protein PKM71_08790 [Candidatus Cloacimonas sp.]|nr:hypothetical protein [Candidatus Cloacimonas sp.]